MYLHRPLACPALAVLVPVVLAACGGGDSTDEAANRAKIASELVQCKNEQSNLKDRIGELETQIAKLKMQAEAGQAPGDAPAPATPQVVHREGNLPPAAAQQVLKKSSGTLRACYEGGLKRNPNLQYVQTVNIHFAVHNNGAAKGISFSPRTDAEMERCMATAIGKWRFPAFTGDPVEIEAPVNLVAK